MRDFRRCFELLFLLLDLYCLVTFYLDPFTFAPVVPDINASLNIINQFQGIESDGVHNGEPGNGSNQADGGEKQRQ